MDAKMKASRKKFYENLAKNNFILVGESDYSKSSTSVMLRCSQKHTFEITPNKIQQGRKCPHCSRKVKKTNSTFAEEVKKKVGEEYLVLGDYVNAKTKLLLQHNPCGYKWEVTPTNFTSGKRCPECAWVSRAKNRTRTDKGFKKEIQNAVGGEYIVTTDYIHSDKKVSMKHIACGYEWEVLPHNFLHKGSRCPSCNESKGEKKISEFLKKNNISFEPQATFDDLIYKRRLYCDFFIPSLNTIIEFDGGQHFKPIKHFGGEKTYEETKIRDEFKNAYARRKGIKMLRIPYWEIENIDFILSENFGF